jgi:hypothetical protein
VIVDGDTAPVVDNPDAPIGQESDFSTGCKACHGLVDGVVDYFPNQVVKPTGTGRSDVHAGPFAHGFEALEDGDVPGVVGRSPGFRSGGATLGGWFGRSVHRRAGFMGIFSAFRAGF